MVRISLRNSRFSLRTYHSYLKTTGIHEYIIRAIKERSLSSSDHTEAREIKFGDHMTIPEPGTEDMAFVLRLMEVNSRIATFIGKM